MTTREAFIAVIREKLGRRAGDPVASFEIDETLVRTVGGDTHPVERFVMKATEAGLHVTTTPVTGSSDALAGVLESVDASSVSVAVAVEWHEAIAAALGSRTVVPGAEGIPPQFEAGVGITDVAAAVAETGSIVVRSGPERSRGAFLLPPVHIAIVLASQIVPDLVDLWPRLQASDLPAHMTIVSGPSKTADIEGILVTGVHGPGEVHVLLVTDA